MSATTDDARLEFLTCTLGGETYGIYILQVQEIREVDRVTRVPHVAGFVRGVVNLRGAIVPIVDLGLMFGMSEPIRLGEASVIVLNANRRLVGLVVKSVSDVVALSADEILPAPDLGDRAVAAAISGIGVPATAGGEAAIDGDAARPAESILLLDVAHLLERIREERE
jgi:purine-binding chemotaxis protein CheW